MKPIYSIQSLISRVEEIPDAIQGEPQTELLGTGPYLAELIENYQSRLVSSTLSGQAESDKEGEEDSEGASFPLPYFRFPGELDPDLVLKKLAGGGAGDQFRSHSLLYGVDAFGYYSSFHLRNYQWGIYLPVTGLAQVAVHVFGDLPIDAHAKLCLATFIVLEHERYHFANDCMIAQMELLVRHPIWWTIKRSAKKDKLTEIEESLANAKMLSRIRQPANNLHYPGAYAATLTFSKTQPRGYCDGHIFATRRHIFDNKLLDLAQLGYEIAMNAEPPYGVEFQHLNPHDRDWDLARCPIHVIHDEHRFGLPELGVLFIQAIPVIVESQKFTQDLNRLDANVRKGWQKTKEKLRLSVSQGSLDFKPWTKDGESVLFSVRVSQSIRAHLRFDETNQTWIGDRIGQHKNMGHG